MMMVAMKLKERQKRRLLNAKSASFLARGTRITQCTGRSDIHDDDDDDNDTIDKDTDDADVEAEYGERPPLAEHSEGIHLVLFTH